MPKYSALQLKKYLQFKLKRSSFLDQPDQAFFRRPFGLRREPFGRLSFYTSCWKPPRSLSCRCLRLKRSR